jgi:hypothetical protein
MTCCRRNKGPKENLPPKLQEMESPSDRKSLEEIVMEGHFMQELLENLTIKYGLFVL